MELDEARKLLMEEEKRKQEECLFEVDAILKKHGYKLQIASNFILVPNPQVIPDGISVPE